MVVACSLYSVCCNHLGMKFIACLSCLPFPWLRDTLPGVSVALGSQPKLQNLSSAMPRGVFLFGFPLLSSPQKCRTENARISRYGGGGQGRYGYRRSTLYALESTDHVSFYTWYCTCRVYPMRLAIQNVHGCPESRVHPPGGRGVNGAVNVQLKQANVFYFLLFRKVQ